MYIRNCMQYMPYDFHSFLFGLPPALFLSLRLGFLIVERGFIQTGPLQKRAIKLLKAQPHVRSGPNP